MTNHQQSLTEYVYLVTETLLNCGVSRAVISPGSRSTPLAYAFSSVDGLETYMHTDERSAAYYALGLAKATGQPVVLLCTSGTAASNYHPAITEAYYARVPLIVITADRPHELREVGAPQAIDQIRMFGSHVKESVDFPIPEDNDEMLRYVEQRIVRLLSAATLAPSGPVHLNMPFREPLLVDFEHRRLQTTFVQRMRGTLALSEEMEDQLKGLLMNAQAGIIVVGEQSPYLNKTMFWEFARGLQWPVLCDPLSNLRSEVPEDCLPLCIDQYDALLKNKRFASSVQPDCVLRFGPQPVSKSLSLFLKGARPESLIVVDESSNFRDPLAVTTHQLQASLESIVTIRLQRERTEYTDQWARANRIAHDVLENDTHYRGDEGHIVRQLVMNLPDETDVVCSSSMPVRDLDTFFTATNRDITLFCNRGTNGIDGVVSTALGIQEGRQRTTYLVIGDLAFLHDLNGLIISRFHSVDLTIVILNNDGGGIFSYLPQAAIESHYERLFGTPTGLTFDHIAAMYDAQYDAVRTMEEFQQALQKPKQAPLRIIEVFTDRAENVAAHRSIWQEIEKQVEQIEG